MQPTGRNHDGYHGETIDIAAVLDDLLKVARQRGFMVDSFPTANGLALYALRRERSERGSVQAQTEAEARPTACSPPRRVYLSTGIHGDEPAGPLAIRQLIHEDPWPADCALWVCPCLNPTGFGLNRRENAAGRDLNRDYLHLRSAEIRAHVAWLRQQPRFDLTLCLHEDWGAKGFYLYELNPDQAPSCAESVIAAVTAVCPKDESPMIDGREAVGGIIRPNLDPASRPEWPEAFYLLQHHTRYSQTLEAPSDFPLSVRVAALVTAVRTALAHLPPRPAGHPGTS